MLIDNKDALTAVDDCNYKIMSGYEWIRKQEIKKRLKELPSAERVGKWIDGCQYGMSGTYWYRYCSECGYIREDDDIDKDSNYCPNCGAKMKGEE